MFENLCLHFVDYEQRVNLAKLGTPTLLRYWRRFNLVRFFFFFAWKNLCVHQIFGLLPAQLSNIEFPTAKQVGINTKPTKEQLLHVVQNHFLSQVLVPLIILPPCMHEETKTPVIHSLLPKKKKQVDEMQVIVGFIHAAKRLKTRHRKKKEQQGGGLRQDWCEYSRYGKLVVESEIMVRTPNQLKWCVCSPTNCSVMMLTVVCNDFVVLYLGTYVLVYWWQSSSLWVMWVGCIFFLGKVTVVGQAACRLRERERVTYPSCCWLLGSVQGRPENIIFSGPHAPLVFSHHHTTHHWIRPALPAPPPASAEADKKWDQTGFCFCFVAPLNCSAEDLIWCDVVSGSMVSVSRRRYNGKLQGQAFYLWACCKVVLLVGNIGKEIKIVSIGLYLNRDSDHPWMVPYILLIIQWTNSYLKPIIEIGFLDLRFEFLC